LVERKFTLLDSLIPRDFRPALNLVCIAQGGDEAFTCPGLTFLILMPATRLSDYHFGSTKRRKRRMVKMAQDEEFGGFNLSDKGFVLAPQLL
jgi:hypothetical protein